MTWGELREIMPARFVEELIWTFHGEGLFLPEDDDAFEPDMIPGHAGGDWPSWPAQEMLEWMPSDVQACYGKRITTVFNGDYLRLPEANEADIFALLADQGFTYRRNDGLVEGASGWATYGAAGFDAKA